MACKRSGVRLPLAPPLHHFELLFPLVGAVKRAEQMMVSGRIDLALESREFLKFSNDQAEPPIANDLEILPYVLAVDDIQMAERHDLPERETLIEDFNRTLQEMRTDGTLGSLLRAHLD